MHIQKIRVRNYKSIVDLSLELAPVTVLIGENGSGKSNLLEAIAFAGAAAASKLDNEFLASRGIRVTDPKFMRAAFTETQVEAIKINFTDISEHSGAFSIIQKNEGGYPRWDVSPRSISFSLDGRPIEEHPAEELLEAETSVQAEAPESSGKLTKFADTLIKALESAGITIPSHKSDSSPDKASTLLSAAMRALEEEYYRGSPLTDFIIYAPETSALRTLEREGQILPLGVRGEGLLRLLQVLREEDPDAWRQLQELMGLLGWFAEMRLDSDGALGDTSLQLKDRYLCEPLAFFDQRSANEGFLFILFFFTALLAKATPAFFAIENVDSSLNPKACTEMMRRLVHLTKQTNKQILITTHNPSLLDGLNLHDDAQRLYVMYRNKHGHTSARRVMPPKPVGKDLPMRLSEAFVKGLLGGIPENF